MVECSWEYTGGGVEYQVDPLYYTNYNYDDNDDLHYDHVYKYDYEDGNAV